MKRWLSVVAIGSIGLVGCSDDDAETASSSSDSNQTRTTSSPTPTGTMLDATFGTGGVLNAALDSGAKDRFSAVEWGEDGKLYAAGLTSTGTDQKIAVARFDTSGKLDTTFGESGIASVNVSPNPSSDPSDQVEQARSLVLTPDGKVIAVGTAEHDASASGDDAQDTDIVAVRFHADGKPDAAFGEDGVARFDIGEGRAVDAETYVGADQGYGASALPDGGLVIFGNSTAGTDREDSDFVLLGVTEDGELDEDFAADGVLKVEDEDETGASARHVKVIGEQILATGYARGTDEIVRPVLIRTSLDGTLDDSFGDDGVAIHEVLGSVAESYQFAAQGEKYVMTGYGKDAAADKVDLIAYRFDQDGKLDPTFGTDGVTRIDNVGEDDRGRNMIVLPDGRIVYVGSGKIDATNQQAMVVVLSADGRPDPGVGDDGRILTDLGSPGDSWYGVALSPDGTTVYLAGYSNQASDDVAGDDAYLGRLKL